MPCIPPVSTDTLSCAERTTKAETEPEQLRLYSSVFSVEVSAAFIHSLAEKNHRKHNLKEANEEVTNLFTK